jgi:CBS domain-containing protein
MMQMLARTSSITPAVALGAGRFIQRRRSRIRTTATSLHTDKSTLPSKESEKAMKVVEHDIPPTSEESTAADMMTSNPISIAADATVTDAVDLLSRRGFSAAPVVDSAGRPVGVLSVSDILVHYRFGDRQHTCEEPIDPYALTSDTEDSKEAQREQARRPGDCLVSTVMTPFVFAIPASASPQRVVHDMLELSVHRLFVVDTDGALIGVVSTMDVLRALQAAAR